jgi:CRP-like cAMP-binding protein
MRQKMAGLAGNNHCPFPLRQRHLADAMGLSFEHVNRMLKELKDKGWAYIQGGRLYISDFEGMSRYCEFDDSYLRRKPLI